MALDVIYSTGETRSIELEYKEVKIPIVVRDLTWAEKNQILDICVKAGNGGTPTFSYDKYMREVLSRIIVSAPWGRTDQMFFSKITPEFGAMLEKLIPKSLGDATTDFLAKE